MGEAQRLGVYSISPYGGASILPANFALPASISIRESPVSPVSGYLSRIRNTPFSILFKLAAKKIYQRLTQWRRKVQIALASNGVLDRGLSDTLYSDVGLSAVIHHQQASGKASFYWCGNYRESMVRTAEDRYPETVPLVIGDADEICEHIFDL